MVTKQGVAVLISGRGSNLANLIKHCNKDGYPAEILCVISNSSTAKGLVVARDHGIPTHVIPKKNYSSKLNAILGSIDNLSLICLAGFMSILPIDVVELWENKIINIHPSLLPAFRGLHAQRQAFAGGVKISGCTVHYVDSGLDTGKIIMQAAVPVLPSDTVDSLSDRILSAEHICYPLALKSVLNPHLDLEKFIFVR